MNSPYGLPSECVGCDPRSNSFFCALSQESLKAFNQIKRGAVFPEGTVIFLLKGKPHVESSCFAKGRPSSPSLRPLGKP